MKSASYMQGNLSRLLVQVRWNAQAQPFRPFHADVHAQFFRQSSESSGLGSLLQLFNNSCNPEVLLMIRPSSTSMLELRLQ